MVTAATKKLRDVFAFGLLVVAALYLVSALSLLFKSEQDAGGPFTARAGEFGYLFSHPILVSSLVVAVAVAVGFGEAGPNAKIVVLAALGIGGLSLLFGVICWVSAFGADQGLIGSLFGGVVGAGKIVGVFLGLAQLIWLFVALLFTFSVFQGLPKRVPSEQQQQWSGQQQWPAQQGYGPPQASSGSQVYGQYGGYGSPQQGHGPQQGYGQPQQGWAPAGPVYGQSQESGSWGAGGHAGSTGATAAGASYGDQSVTQQGWGQPPLEQQGWGQPPAEQQGWGQPPAEQQGWGQPPAEQQGWGQPPAEQQGWGQPPAEQNWSQESSQQAMQEGDQLADSATPGGEQFTEQPRPDTPAWTSSWGRPDDPGRADVDAPGGAHPADEGEYPGEDRSTADDGEPRRDPGAG